MTLRKILPFNSNPVIKTFPYAACYVGILDELFINKEDVLLADFLNIRFLPQFGVLDFTSSGFFQLKYFKHKRIDLKVKISINAIKTELIKEHYVFVVFNEKYITNQKIHTQHDYYHDWMIFGFDDEKEVFLCAGYAGEGRFRNFSTVEISYSDMEGAIKNTRLINKYFFKSTAPHSSWLKRKSKCTKINKRFLIRKLNSFINSKAIMFYYRPVINANKRGLDALLNYMKSLLSNWQHKKNPFFHMHSFRILLEHIKVLRLYAIKLNFYDDFKDEFDDLEKNAEILFFCALKYNVTPDYFALEKTVELLDKVIEKEDGLIKKMIAQ